MNPVDFIHQHIVAALVADGVPDAVAERGGGERVLSTITDSLRQVVRVQPLTIVYGKRGCGFSSIVRKQNASQPVSASQNLRFSQG